MAMGNFFVMGVQMVVEAMKPRMCRKLNIVRGPVHSQTQFLARTSPNRPIVPYRAYRGRTVTDVSNNTRSCESRFPFRS